MANMSRSYFDLSEDVYVPGRWLLGEVHTETGVTIPAFEFRKGVPFDVEGVLRIPFYRQGTSLDFSYLVGEVVPIVSRRVAEIFTSLAANDVQLIPARVESQADDYYIANITRTVKCIDDVASEGVRYWRPEDGLPDKLGSYQAVYGLRVDPSQIPPDIKLFCPQGWTVVLVVSEEIHDALERIGATGTKFIPV